MNKNIALGILVYNEENHITAVLNDLKFFNLKIYIVNDASTDMTMDEINKFDYQNFNKIY